MMRRRELLVGAVSGLLGACASGPGGRVVGAVADAAARMGSMEQPEPSVDDVVDSITTLEFDDLERTPIEKIKVTVYYELENHPEVDKELFKATLPAVAWFYKNYGSVDINFEEVDSLESKDIDNRTSFGIRYLSPDHALQAQRTLKAVDLNRFKPKESDREHCMRITPQTIAHTVCSQLSDEEQTWEPTTTEIDEEIIGAGFANHGILLLRTPRDYLTELKEHKAYVDKLRAELPTHPSLGVIFPKNADMLALAKKIAHELGHIFGLYHSHQFIDDELVDARPYRQFGSRPSWARDIPNIMSYEKPIVIMEDGDVRRISFSDRVAFGYIMNLQQANMMHNRLRGGIVHRTIMQRGYSGYIEALGEVNGLTKNPKLLGP